MDAHERIGRNHREERIARSRSGRCGGDEREEREGVEHGRSLSRGGAAPCGRGSRLNVFVAARPEGASELRDTARTIPDGA